MVYPEGQVCGPSQVAAADDAPGRETPSWRDALVTGPSRRPTVSTVRVVCSVPTLEQRLEAWVEGGRLNPPFPVTLHVRVADTTAVALRGEPVFEQPGVEIRSGGRDGGVQVVWRQAAAVADLPRGAATATVVLSEAAVAQLEECESTFLTTVLIFLLRRAGWHHVHAATAVDPGGRGWLLAGNARAGKSTTAAWLASRGWSVGTDDMAFLAPGPRRVVVHAYRAPIALREEGQALLQRTGGMFLQRRRKVGYWPEDLGSRWISCVEPDLVLFPVIGERTEVRLLSAGDTLARLVRWSAWVLLEPELAQEHLDLLTRLTAQAPGYGVTLGPDLFAHPERLEDALR